MSYNLLIPLTLMPLAIGNTSVAHAKGMTQEHNQQEVKRPNIILFMVDDMGWQDTSLPFWTE